MSDFNQRLFAAFEVEYREHLEHIRAILSRLEAGGAPLLTDLDEGLRRAHNLKGAARAVDLHLVEKVAHRLESIFARAGRGVLPLDAACCGLCQRALDSIEDLVSGYAAGQRPVEPAGVLAEMERLLEREAAAPGVAVASEPVAPSGPVTEPAAPAEDTMRVAVSRVERLLAASSQILTESMRQNVLRSEMTSFGEAIGELVSEWERTLRRGARLPESARSGLHLDRLNAYIRGLSRQVRRLQRLQNDSAWSLQRQGRRLHDDVRAVLMIPARGVFEGFPKLMRDLARDLGKSFEFSMQGLEVRADRRVLQAIKDPLVHLLRNAASHGIETAAERTAQGKRPGGRVLLSLEARGNRLLVRVEDDGRGVDFQRVAQVAAKRGLLPAADEVPSAADLARILFLPGFSTSQVITEVSGRGIGLSVVGETLGRLQGEAHVEPRAGGGTVFVLSVPLSLSMQPLLLVQCQGQNFGIPSVSIERLYRVQLEETYTAEGKPVIETPSGAVPLWSLGHLLYGDHSSPTQVDGVLSVAVVKTGERRVAIAVDAFVDKVDGAIKEVGTFHDSGGIVLGDGSICLVLNPTDLVEASNVAAQTPLQAAEQPPAAPLAEDALPWVLVVDDSFTTRTLEKGILESNGYRVLLATDGIEALGVLRAEKVDLVISDIQMPRMDGFGLLEAVRADPRLKHLPVILVTSLETRADQERGLSLGADAYIVKRKFDQRDLLDSVRQLL